MASGTEWQQSKHSLLGQEGEEHERKGYLPTNGDRMSVQQKKEGYLGPLCPHRAWGEGHAVL